MEAAACAATSAARATSPGSALAGATSTPAALSAAQAASCSPHSASQGSAEAAAYSAAASAATSPADPAPPGKSMEAASATMKRARGEEGDRVREAGTSSSATVTLGLSPASLSRIVAPDHRVGEAPAGCANATSTLKPPAQPLPGAPALACARGSHSVDTLKVTGPRGGAPSGASATSSTSTCLRARCAHTRTSTSVAPSRSSQRRRYTPARVSSPPATTAPPGMDSATAEGRRALRVLPQAPLNRPPMCMEAQAGTVPT